MKPHFIIPSQGHISLNEYRQVKGNSLKLARTINPKEIIAELKASGLRGRGGAGFPTGVKWETLYVDKSEQKYVVVNAAEGEPGTFKDRFILRKNPYALIEGALIAAHVLNTTEIYIAIKNSFNQERVRLEDALREFKEQNELQNELQGELQDIHIHIVAGPEDYLFGEEKALLNVIEGIGPLPREAHYPPYEIGLFATPNSRNPALVSNVETYARVPDIILKGAESFRTLGTVETPGAIICTLFGDIKRPGVYEIQPGLTIRELIDLYGLGPKEFNVKAILTGVSNRVLTSLNLDTKIGFSSLAEVGGGLGSAGFMIYDESRSIPRLTQVIAKFLYRESCNQCTACKTGLGIASSALDNLLANNTDKLLIEKIILGVKSAPQSNRCFLPVQGSILIPSLINSFKEEFSKTFQNEILQSEYELLPRMIDFIEDENKFILKQAEFKNEPTIEDWKTSERIIS
ncbi:MAG: NADH-ubiquinone oxidoreductase-F iron-sulfur binding region domain-containing protein [Bacteriovorax sp.]|nr:NADH-ubiquinone oxidoreductase-F iron-sulfur binding region domain-containing protein [Bacteriovorax sp.]